MNGSASWEVLKMRSWIAIVMSIVLLASMSHAPAQDGATLDKWRPPEGGVVRDRRAAIAIAHQSTFRRTRHYMPAVRRRFGKIRWSLNWKMISGSSRPHLTKINLVMVFEYMFQRRTVAFLVFLFGNKYCGRISVTRFGLHP